MDRRPDDHIANPRAIATARERGWPITMETLADAAKLGGLELWLPASDALEKQGLDELRRARNSVRSTPMVTPPAPKPTEPRSALTMTDGEFDAAVRAKAWRS